MLKMHLAAGLAATALMTAAAVAQTSTTAPATSGGASTTMGTSGSAGSGTMGATGSSGASSTMGSTSTTSGAAASGQLMTQMQPDMMRGSKLMGTDIYGSDNQKIGDLDDVILDRQGKVQAIVVGVGGFLGIGEKNVAIPYDQVQWMSSQEVQAQNNQSSGTTTAGGTNNAGGMTTASGGASQPATTGSTAGGTTAAGSSGSNDTMPARGMVRMTKADLQNAPEFRFNSDNRSNAAGGAAGTNPPANANRPGNAPAQ